MKRTEKASLLLLPLLFVSLLASCGETAEQPKNADTGSVSEPSVSEPAVEETETAQNAAPLPETDLGGAEIRMLIRTEWDYEMTADGENGDPINDAVFRRNKAVEEAYNCVLVPEEMPGTWGDVETAFRKRIHNSVTAEDAGYDFALAYQAGVPYMVNQGDLLDLRVLPYLELSAPWWCREGLEVLTVNDKCFLLGGDIGISLSENLYCMLFNKRLTAAYDIPDLYETVRSGKWTHDAWLSVCKDVYSDVNGDGKTDGGDTYGSATSSGYICNYIVAYQTPSVGKTNDGLVCIWNTERTTSVVEAIVDMTNYPAIYSSPDGYTSVPQMFRNGQIMIAPGFIGDAAELRDMDDDFGIIPYPKFDEEQPYLTTTLNEVSMAVVPLNTPDSERTGLILEALCRKSHETLQPAFYDKALKGKYTRDEESLEMLDLIRSSLTFDFGWIHSVVTGISGYKYYEHFYAKKSTDFVSWYTSEEKNFEKKLDAISEIYYED